MNCEKLKIPGLADQARQVNEAIDAELAEASKADSGRVSELAELTKAKDEITSRLPDLSEKAIRSDDFASALNSANSRISLIESKISALRNSPHATVQMTGASLLISDVVAHYIQHLPEALDDYFRPVASEIAARNALIQIAECTRAVGMVRDSWNYFGGKTATAGNRRLFNDIMRRAAAGQYHLLADCNPEN
ncbi:MAG TPA: hypothetical protein VGO67_05445 [Verrucomicrobiae bacterium]|jgi:hypothetical protein